MSPKSLARKVNVSTTTFNFLRLMNTLKNISIEVKAIAATLILIVVVCAAFTVPSYMEQKKEREAVLKQCEAKMDSLIATVEFAEGIYEVMPLGQVTRRDLLDHGGTFELVKAYDDAYNFANDSIMPIASKYGIKAPNEIEDKYESIRTKLQQYRLHQFKLVCEDLVAMIYIDHYDYGKYTEKEFREKVRKQKEENEEKIKAGIHVKRWDEIKK